MDKDTKKLLKAVEAQGFTYRKTAKGHYQIRDAGGQVVCVVAGTGSDWRGLRNAVAALKRAGFKPGE